MSYGKRVRRPVPSLHAQSRLVGAACLGIALSTASMSPATTVPGDGELGVLRSQLDEGRLRAAGRTAFRLVDALEQLSVPDRIELARQLDRLLAGRLPRATPAVDLLPLARAAVALERQLLSEEDDDRIDSLLQLGRTLTRARRYDEADASCDEARALAERLAGPRSAAAAAALDCLAGVLAGRRRFDAALELYRDAHPLHVDAVGKWSRVVARNLIGQGHVHYQAGRYALAVEAYGTARAVLEQTATDSSLELARVDLFTARCLYPTGDYATALERARRSLELFERDPDPEAVERAEALDTLGSIAQVTGDYTLALEQFRRSLALRESSLGLEHVRVARSLDLIGSALLARGDYDEARPLYLRSIAIHRSSPDSTDDLRAGSLGALASLEYSTGHYERSNELNRRAIELRERERGPDSPRLVGLLGNRAVALDALGEHDRARPLYERALAIHEDTYGERSPYLPGLLYKLAYHHIEIGQHELAAEAYERALEVQRATLGADHPGIAVTLDGLAQAADAAGDLDRTVALLRQALAIREEAFGADHHWVAGSLTRLARRLVRQGRRDDAEPLLARALNIYESEAELASSPALAAVLEALGALQDDRGEWRAAEVYYRRALGHRERTQGDTHPKLARSLLPLAWSLWRSGERDEPLQLAQRASEVIDGHLREMLAALPERRALRFVDTRARPEELIFTGVLAAEGEERERWLEQAWLWTLRRRGGVLDAAAERQRAALSERSGPAHEALVELMAARRRLAALWGSGAGAGSAEAYREKLQAAQAARDRAELEFARVSATYRTTRALENLSIGELAGTLDGGFVLVEVVRVDVRLASMVEPEARYLALTLDRAGDRRALDLGPAVEIDGEVRAWRSELAAAAAGGEGRELHRIGHRLRRRVWEPIARHLQSVDTVLLVPDGALHQVQWAALPDSTGTYLVEDGPRIHLLTSARAWVGARRHDSAERRAHGVLAVGAPAYGVTAEPQQVAMLRSGPRSSEEHCEPSALEPWAPLPESGREVEQIADLFADKETVRLLVGESATESELRRLAAGNRIVHLATHAFFLDDSCRSPERRSVDNPLLMSGVVLSGANRGSGAVAELDDGILTAEEIATLDLRGVELAVLSGCDTGLGEVAVGEGVLGLRRALELAGARSLVMSLWPVPDRQARRWMRSFYTAYLSGSSLVDAAHTAHQSLLAAQRERGRSTHPYLWAGFVTAGGWN